MGFVITALRKPIMLLVAILAIVLVAIMAVTKMPIDIFPSLGVPVIYVSQPYGGLDPTQLEGHVSTFYENQFLYVSGIKSIESKNIQGEALFKLSFYPGTDMASSMAEVIGAINRAKNAMPPGTVPPQVIRFDAGNIPVGDLVLSSKTKSVGEIQDIANIRVRPMFASLPGVSSPPPFGGNQRTIVITVDPSKLRDYHLTPDDVIRAIAANNTITPSGNVGIGKLNRLAPMNTVVDNPQELANIPLVAQAGPTVFLRDVGTVADSTDTLVGYALVNGKRSVYIPVTKRADASTWNVVQEVKATLPAFKDAVPADVHVSYEFDQSGYVANALSELVSEGVIGAVLTGLMVLMFLRCWRSTVIVVATIPISLLCALIGLWMTGQTINTMTLGGLALAIGILVDEATVAIENIHTHLAQGKFKARAVFDSAREIGLPLLLAMICVLAVFLPSFFMSGVPRALFIPLSLAVGFAMVASYVLSQTLVPVLSVWLLDNKSHHPETENTPSKFSLTYLTFRYAEMMEKLLKYPRLLVPCYLIIALALLALIGGSLGSELFPKVEGNQFKFRLKAPTGTRVEETERLTLKALDIVKQEVGGSHNVSISLAYVGTQPSSYASAPVYLWTSGPQDSVISVALKKDLPIKVNRLEEKLRERFQKEMPTGTTVSFEPADLVSQVMNQGATTPVEIAVLGKSLREDHAFAGKLKTALAKLPYIRDLQDGQPYDYPTLNIRMDRALVGQMGLTVQKLSQSIIAATSSTRFVLPNFWLDKDKGAAYQVQVQIPQNQMASDDDLKAIPATDDPSGHPTIGDVSDVTYGHTYGEIDRLNSKRMVSVIANLHSKDLGSASRDIQKVVDSVGKPPHGMDVKIRGQVALMLETLEELKGGLFLAIAAIFLLLAANYQSFKLSLVVVSTLPAVLCGAVVMLALTGTTLNIQSAMGAIMALGVAVANAILLVTMAENYRKQWGNAAVAALEGARTRLRPILMTSLAMSVGMIPMASGLGEGGGQSAPLGRAVIGGIIASTFATLTILPLVFTWVQGNASIASPSLDPEDPESPHYDANLPEANIKTHE